MRLSLRITAVNVWFDTIYNGAGRSSALCTILHVLEEGLLPRIEKKSVIVIVRDGKLEHSSSTFISLRVADMYMLRKERHLEQLPKGETGELHLADSQTNSGTRRSHERESAALPSREVKKKMER
jgi:hypothetical protein